ncbi:MAG: hypothetical protein KKB37_11245 [Alphaproteobacteria bacterium]|nr:hypothetical protein [Alphaproteobacteria bacterium]
MALGYHKYANAFPMISGADRVAFVESIRANGIKEEIVVCCDDNPDGEILDGRNRFEAGIETGKFADDVDWRADANFVDFREIEPDMDPLDWVKLKNLDGRRHLSQSMRAMIAAKIEGFRHGGLRPEQDANLHLDEVDAEPNGSDLATRGRRSVAEDLHVSPRSVASAAKVLKDGAPELEKAVSEGAVKVSVAAEIAALPKDEQVAIIKSADPSALSVVVKEIRDKRTADKKARRTEKEQQLGRKLLAIGDRKATVLYVDIDWRFLTRSANGLDRSADNHYPTSALVDIMKRPVSDMAARDAVIFFWATVPMLIEAICVLDAYGFVLINRDPETGFLLPDKSNCHYVSQQAWVKTDSDGEPANGTGYWFRNGHEILLVARRGNIIAPAMGTQPNSVQQSLRGEHSAKPEDVLELIEHWYPTVPKLELHRRGKPRPGWWAWGNEVEADPENGVTVDENGFADASHLPLLKQSGSSQKTETSSAPSGGDKASPVTSLDGADSGLGGSDTGAAAGDASGPVAVPAIHLGWQQESEGLENRFRTLGADLPKTTAGLIEAYADAMGAYDTAMRTGTEDAARLAGERMGAVLFKANGDRMYALEVAKAPMAIRKATSAKPGQTPIWGQNGCFTFKGKRMAAIVECAWPTLNFFAATDAPFFSETGFRAVHTGVDGLGMSVTDFISASIEAVLAAPGEALVTPAHIYRIGRTGPVPVHNGDKS